MISASENIGRKFLTVEEEHANCRELSALNARLLHYPIFQVATSGKQFAYPVRSCSHLAAYLHKHTICKLLCQPVSQPVVVAPRQCQCIDARPDMHKTSSASLHERWEELSSGRNQLAKLLRTNRQRKKPTLPPSDIYTASDIPPRARNLEPRRAGSLPGHHPSFCAVIRPDLSPSVCPSVPPTCFLHRGGGRKGCRCPGLGCPVIVTHTFSLRPF